MNRNRFSGFNISDFPRKVTLVQILKPKPYQPEEDYMSFDILAPNVTVPDQPTTYFCSVQRLPLFKHAIHGIGFDAVLANANRRIVHHIEVRQ